VINTKAADACRGALEIIRIAMMPAGGVSRDPAILLVEVCTGRAPWFSSQVRGKPAQHGGWAARHHIIDPWRLSAL